MNTFNKQIDILCMEFDRDMSILEDSMVISEYDGSYFTEASNGNKENFFKKAIRKVKEFIQKIISKLEEKFSKNKLAQKQKAFEIECQKDPSKRNKKVKVRVNDKVYTLSKKAMNDLMKCKTKEEAEKYMEDYRKKREKNCCSFCCYHYSWFFICISWDKTVKNNKTVEFITTGT